MSGYTSTYRTYESRKLANGGLKVKDENVVANGGGKCDDDNCYVVRVNWNYRIEVSVTVLTFVNMCICAVILALQMKTFICLTSTCRFLFFSSID